jgi:beta-mannosidase
MEHHQRSPIGNTTIVSHMTEWFLFPKDFESTLWLSQIQQGMAMKYACEHWRRNMPRSMGALYWQLNDCWPVASWSSIDSFGRYKALQYMARHFFAPVLVSGVENEVDGTVTVFVCNDQRVPLRAELKWLATDASGKKLRTGSLRVRVSPGKSAKLARLELADLLRTQGKNDLLVWLQLGENERLVSENLISFARPKHLELADPELRSTIRSSRDGYEVTLEAKRVALFCWVDLARSDATFSDNFVHLQKGQKRKLRVHPMRKLNRASFEKQLRIRHLGSTHDP